MRIFAIKPGDGDSAIVTFYSTRALRDQPNLEPPMRRRSSTLQLTCAVLLLPFLMGACSKKEAPAPSPPTSAPKVATATKQPPGIPVPDEEPSAEVVRKLEFQRYEAIEKQGGMPMTVTATGQSIVLRPKLYEVRKESCKPQPQQPPGNYECSSIIKLSLAPDGRNPSEQGSRVGITWDSQAGEWVLDQGRRRK